MLRRSDVALWSGLAALLLVAPLAGADEATYSSQRYEDGRRSAYTYVRFVAGDAALQSPYNGRVTVGRNLPVSGGDEISVSESGRVEIALADGNLLEIGGGTQARFASLADQQGDEDNVSAIRMSSGSVILAAMSSSSQDLPRIDTDEASVYVSVGARVRVNADPRRGSVVVVRAGTAEVRTPQGSYKVHAGEYLIARAEEEPEIERGTFSRDRFDIWAADRLETALDPHGVASRYVDSDYSSDVASMDGYGDWSYSPEYGTDVWSPHVEPGWTPYSNGSWYYTPVGLTWWGYDPWGWYPFHYGSWCFSAVWNNWCWLPASVYSPAWVYWGFSPGYVGWCPIGVYSYWSPWFDSYFKQSGWAPRGGVAIALQGTFAARSVDFHGWNFTGSRNFASSNTRMDVISGTRIADRLAAGQISVSSRPIVVSPRAGGVHEAIATFVREAPLSIARSSGDSARLAPILSHQRTLPADTLAAAAQHSVVARGSRLSGPGVAEVAPRGALVDRTRTLPEIAARAPSSEDGRSAVRPNVARPNVDWRSRSLESRSTGALRADERPSGARTEQAPSLDWRSRRATTDPTLRSGETARRDEWRAREDLPPARRVIEGAVPRRRGSETVEDATRARSWREGSSTNPPREFSSSPREFRAEPRPAPRYEYREPREVRPAPQAHAPHVERAPAASAPPPPPHVERAPVQSAPPPHSEPHHAPPPNHGRPDK
jgi:hypothetical protein